jgi:hypothetical protein
MSRLDGIHSERELLFVRDRFPWCIQKLVRILFLETDRTNENIRNGIWITVGRWSSVFEIAALLFANLTRNAH